MALLRSHGITRDPAAMTHEADGAWYYQQIDLGYNYRMTELQAALGVSQMRRLDEFVARRHELAERYDRLLAPLPPRSCRRAIRPTARRCTCIRCKSTPKAAKAAAKCSTTCAHKASA